ncbi:MAG TPA: helical backbone metal receptor [Thermoanaerobaculia bacterium]|nr:helical backbone metal receptor [Thermoanaerobaculia bacterium]
MTDLRIVSLCPSLTETLVEIGVMPVGVTRYCIRPREALRKVSKVGGTKNPDLDRIRILAPDLVVANAEENRPEDLAALGKEFAVHVSLPRTVAEVPGVVRELGVAVGRPEEGKRLAAEIERATAVPGPATFRYAYFIWKDPWMSVSGDTYVSDLLRYAGGANVFGEEPARYPEITPARVRAAAPDVLFFPSEPFPFSEGHRPAIEAVFGRSTPIEFVDGDDCCWHGARTRDGLGLMREIRRRFAGDETAPGV